MHHHKLRNLFALNARKGDFRAEGNTIFLYDMIVSSKADAEWFGGVDAETFSRTLRSLSGDVSVRVNSPGGDVFAARAMAQAISEYPGKVTVHVDGFAASAASFLTSAADRTLMAPGAMIMIHNAWSLALGNAADMRQTADLLDKIDQTIVQTYADAADRRGVTAPDFAALMAAETWFTGDEALAAGLADEVIVDTVKVENNWDLSVFANAPKFAPAAAVTPPSPRADITADMSARQAGLYEAIEGVTEGLGQFDQTSGANGAHYMADNPFAATGIKCANCAFYDGTRACEVVAGDIDPDAVCKLWIIPETLISEPAPSAQAEIEQQVRPNLAADLLLRPAA